MELVALISLIEDEIEKLAYSWNDDTGKKIRENMSIQLENIKNIDNYSRDFFEKLNECFSLYPAEEIESYYRNMLLFINEDN